MYHAETIHVRASNAEKIPEKVTNTISELGTSKPLCAHCDEFVSKQGNFKYVQEAMGTPSEKVTNWWAAKEISIKRIDLIPTKQPMPPPPPDTALSPTKGIKPDELCQSSRKRKRATSSRSCIFRVRNDDITKVQEIDTDGFMKKYRESGTADRLRLSKIVGDNASAKLIGDPTESNAFNKILKHEKMTSHVQSTAKATESIKTGNLEMDSVKGAKLSPSKVRFQLSNRLAKITKGAERASGALGSFLLAKSIADGIASGDTTGLCIMGGRVGGEIALEVGAGIISKVATKVAARAGAKLGVKATAKLASKSFKVISDAAGPIGSVADVGLSAWHLSSAINTLTNPNATKFEQNAAIADIVAESIDIVITTAVTVASIAFPPFAPIFAVVGIISSLIVTTATRIYQATNHVNMIDSKIKLLDFEKKNEFNRNMIGKDTSKYILDLIDTKFANDLAVNASITFLQENPDIIGHVFPARTLKLDGGCMFVKIHCEKKFLWKCTQESQPTILARNCYKNGRCLDQNYYCRDKTVGDKKTFDRFYRCKCYYGERFTFGSPEPNQFVDFRKIQRVYRYRAIGDYVPSGYNLHCYPSTTTNNNNKMWDPKPRNEYLCRNSIAVKRNSPTGEYMLFDLKDGDDIVYIGQNDKTANRFLVGKGEKKFYSGPGDDVFIVEGNCEYLSGILDGGRGNDALAFGNNCAPNRRLHINMSSASMAVERNNKATTLKNINIIYGRQNQGDSIMTSCSTKFVDGGCGARYNMDVITLEKKRCPSRSEKLTVMANSSTSVITYPNLRETLVVVPSKATNVEIVGGSKNLTVFIQNAGAQYLTIYWYNKQKLSLSIRGMQSVSLTHPESFVTLLEEEDGDPSQIVVRGEDVNCLHRLSTSKTKRRTGCRRTRNVFELLQGGYWEVRGGDKDDIFRIADNIDVNGTRLFGGHGQDELHLESPSGVVTFNLTSGIVRIVNGVNQQRLWIHNIESFFGRKNKQDIFYCKCPMTFVSGKGGASKEKPDKIYIMGSCQEQLTIVLAGYTNIDARSTDRNTINIIFGSEFSTETQIDLHLTKNLNFAMHFLTTFSNSFRVHLSPNQLNITVDNREQKHDVWINLKFSNNLFFDPERVDQCLMHNLPLTFEEKVGAPITLLLPCPSNRTLLPQNCLIVHEIGSVANVRQGKRQGQMSYPNYFRIAGGTTDWTLVGGNLNDVFELYKPTRKGSIDGGTGINDLIIQERSRSAGNRVEYMNIDLNFRNVIYKEIRERYVMPISNIHRIFGSDYVREIIVPACDTQLISCGGPYSGFQDHIKLTKTCNNEAAHADPSPIRILASGYLKVTERNRSFSIQVRPSSPDNRIGFILDSMVDTLPAKELLINLHPQNLSQSYYNLRKPRYYLSMSFAKEQNIRFDLQLQPNASIDGDYLPGLNVYFISQKNFHANLQINKHTGRPLIFIAVQSDLENVGLIQGASAVSNYFSLIHGSDIFARGGVEDDFFSVNIQNVTNTVIDGLGGSNTIGISAGSNSDNTLIVDFQENALLTNNTKIEVQNIQNFIGQEGAPDIVYVNCDTNIVRPGGGNKTNFDALYVRDNLSCNAEGPNQIFYLTENTEVQNNFAGNGTFTYVVEAEDNLGIQISSSNQTNHIFRLQYAMNLITSTSFNRTATNLNLNIRSGMNLTIPMNTEHENTKVLLENGNDKSFFYVKNNEDGKSEIVVTTVIQDGSPQKLVHGISGAQNDISINIQDDNVLRGVAGAEKDDKFRLKSFKFVDHIDGAGGSYNHLDLSETEISKSDDISVDLRHNSTKAIKSKPLNSTIVRKLSNIGILTGRGSTFDDQVYIGCNTMLVSGIKDVVISETDCPNHQLTVIEIDKNTTVSFTSPRKVGPFPATVFRNATFHYKLNVIRSFQIETEFLMDIRLTTQVFHLALQLKVIEAIQFFETNGTLKYTVGGEDYFHVVDTFLHWDDEFFASPKFLTQDGFQIKISRQGEIFFVGAISLQQYEDNEIAKHFMLLAEKLKATFIVSGTEGNIQPFVYFGHSETRNVLTNINTRSLLSGGGGNSTVYVITDLQHDVKIYPGLNLAADTIQTLDLTNVIFPIRKFEDANKYIPKIFTTGDDLEIRMENYTTLYPASVIIVGGARYVSQFYLLLDTVAMKIEETTLGKRERRSSDERVEMKLVPKPLVLSQEKPMAIMSLNDFELGQRILYPQSSNYSASQLLFARNGTDIVVTNLNGLSDGLETDLLRSLILVDGGEQYDTAMKNLAESIVEITDNDKVKSEPMSLRTRINYATANDGTEDFEDALERIEGDLLAELPEVPRRFQISLLRRIWKHHKVEAISLLALGFFGFGFALLWLCWLNNVGGLKYKLYINPTESVAANKENLDNSETSGAGKENHELQLKCKMEDMSKLPSDKIH